MPATAPIHVGMTWLLTSIMNGNADTSLGWAGRRGRHGGEAPAVCVGTDDVGLELLVLFFQEKRTRE